MGGWEERKTGRERKRRNGTREMERVKQGTKGGGRGRKDGGNEDGR